MIDWEIVQTRLHAVLLGLIAEVSREVTDLGHTLYPGPYRFRDPVVFNTYASLTRPVFSISLLISFDFLQQETCMHVVVDIEWETGGSIAFADPLTVMPSADTAGESDVDAAVGSILNFLYDNKVAIIVSLQSGSPDEGVWAE